MGNQKDLWLEGMRRAAGIGGARVTHHAFQHGALCPEVDTWRLLKAAAVKVNDAADEACLLVRRNADCVDGRDEARDHLRICKRDVKSRREFMYLRR